LNVTTHTITDLTLQKRNRQRVNVYLDGDFAFGLARIVAAWLHVGQQLSDEKILQLQAEDAHETAYQRASNFVNYRPRTEAEIRRSLHQHNIPEEIIDHTIERLKQIGLVDDARFAQNWVDMRTDFRPRSRRALASELGRLGVDAEIISESLASVDNEEMAYQAAVKRSRKLQDLEWKDFRQKMYQYLAQRGFDYEACTQAISRVWEEISSQNRPSHDGPTEKEEINP
jgi:regulatory protein